MDKNLKIYIAGHHGMVGGGISRLLKMKGYANIITVSHDELDLLNQADVINFFETHKPDIVFLAAAKVGGLAANIAHPAPFIHDNLAIQTNVIHAAYKNNCRKFIFLGSSCIYPRECKQPMKEEYLMTGNVEPTNEMYAIAKIAGVKMCEAYRREYGFDAITIQPPNLYGEGDHFSLDKAHVMGALMHRFYRASLQNTKSISVWGTGNARRELMYVDDAASACLFAMENNLGDHAFFNAGVNEDISIKDLAYKIAALTQFKGNIKFDATKPEGIPRKLMDSNRLYKQGWQPQYSFEQGIEKMYQYFLRTYAPIIEKEQEN